MLVVVASICDNDRGESIQSASYKFSKWVLMISNLGLVCDIRPILLLTMHFLLTTVDHLQQCLRLIDKYNRFELLPKIWKLLPKI